MKYFHIPTFLISFCIGLFFVYITAPKMQTIYVYPTPENTNKILYKDDSNICFKLTPKEVPCKEKNSNYPLQSFIEEVTN